MAEDNRVGKLLATNRGGYIDAIVYLAIRFLIIVGYFALIIDTMLAESYAWGGEFPSGGYWDAWGVRIYSGFFEVRDFAVSLLVVASLLYPIRLWFDDMGDRRKPKNGYDYHLYAGLLLPSIVVFGQPRGLFYPDFIPGTIDFSLTGIVFPLWNFVFTGQYQLDASIIFVGLPSPHLVLGVISFILGIGQIWALKAYEKSKIKLGLFLVPVLTSLFFSILLFGSEFPSLNYSQYSWYIFPHFAETCYAIPMLTVGVLVKAIGIHKDGKQ